MKKVRLNFIVDGLAFAGFALLTSTGVLLQYLLPAGSGRWRTVWGMTRHQWGDIHLAIAIVLLSILTLHLFLHWRWIFSTLKGRLPEQYSFRVLLGIVGLLALIALAIAPLVSGVEEMPRGESRGRPHSQSRN